jgi:hypothetical protein
MFGIIYFDVWRVLTKLEAQGLVTLSAIFFSKRKY